jgi:hypothetical protein
MIITFLAYLVIFILVMQIICCYVKKRTEKYFKRINYSNDSNDSNDFNDSIYTDNIDIESQY